MNIKSVSNCLSLAFCLSFLLISLTGIDATGSQSGGKTQDDSAVDKLSKAFLDSVKSGDFARFKALTPTEAVWRKVGSKLEKGKSNAEIAKAVKENLEPKWRADFDNIQRTAKEGHIDLSRLQFVAATMHSNPENKDLTGLEIECSYNGAKVSFPLSVTQVDGQYYMLDILLSTNLFRNVPKGN